MHGCRSGGRRSGPMLELPGNRSSAGGDSAVQARVCYGDVRRPPVLAETTAAAVPVVVPGDVLGEPKVVAATVTVVPSADGPGSRRLPLRNLTPSDEEEPGACPVRLRLSYALPEPPHIDQVWLAPRTIGIPIILPAGPPTVSMIPPVGWVWVYRFRYALQPTPGRIRPGARQLVSACGPWPARTVNV